MYIITGTYTLENLILERHILHFRQCLHILDIYSIVYILYLSTFIFILFIYNTEYCIFFHNSLKGEFNLINEAENLLSGRAFKFIYGSYII